MAMMPVPTMRLKGWRMTRAQSLPMPPANNSATAADGMAQISMVTGLTPH
ncbi:MAG: hypothetical protein R3D67_19365 [Hyphomicrobiaceae bacterium]